LSFYREYNYASFSGSDDMGGRLGDIIVILIVALVLFGGNKLPEIGKALGSALAEFKKAVNTTPEPQPQSQPNQPLQPALAAAPATPAKRRRSPARRGRSKSSR
jgi:sec-independent protein translocase protein TatA